MGIFFAALLSLIVLTATQKRLLDCNGGGAGPCGDFGSCPDNATQKCILTSGGELCCDLDKIIDATTTIATTPKPTTCVDRLNPKTGTSDCPSVAYLCSNSIYYTLMTEQCPKTCNRCDGSATAPSGSSHAGCMDKVNPRTGVSDCTAYAYLCNNALYRQVMVEQCPKTCNKCPGAGNSGSTSTCTDLVNPRTGISDCTKTSSYCRNPIYKQLMQEQCPRTCGHCI